ncbi:MAG: ABC transporter ATP-binding protein [Pigmentiphaga sp.]|nr:ABC transporter ATP-binding protein [Pigmentiphaga sp.]
MLELSQWRVAYGQHLALQGVELSVGKGEVVVILGTNGAGKSSLLKSIAGLVPALPGSSLRFDGHELLGKPAREIVEAGIALVPEGRGIFGELTVRENLLLGAYARRARQGEAGRLESVVALFPKLGQRMKQVVQTMSGGEQQMVAIGRALMSNPSLLLLDEPSLGLSPIMTGELFKALARVRQQDLAILLVEQNAKRSLALADRGYLIENGRIVGQGPAAQLRNDPAVQKAYLGGAAGAAA